MLIIESQRKKKKSLEEAQKSSELQEIWNKVVGEMLNVKVVGSLGEVRGDWKHRRRQRDPKELETCLKKCR